MSLNWYPALINYDSIPKYEHTDYKGRVILSDFIDYVCKSIDGVSLYKFDESFYETDGFDEFKRIITNACSLEHYSEPRDEHLVILSGEAGIGKTLFFREGIKVLLHDETITESMLIINMRNINEQANDYTEEFYEDLLTEITFKMDSSIKCETEYDYIRAIAEFGEEVNRTKHRPLIIVVDNMDLCEFETQRETIRTIRLIRERLNSYVDTIAPDLKFVIFLAVRPETYIRNELAYDDNCLFPHPKVSRIYEHVIKDAFDKAFNHFGNKEINLRIESENLLLPDISALIDYFVERTVTQYIDYWKIFEGSPTFKFGTIDSFHNYLVNFNIRRILNFFAKTLKNGGFRPLRYDDAETNRYGFYDHLNYLICGAHTFHPGNSKMDGEGFHSRSPIIMNLFDMEPWMNENKANRNYFIFLRIIQYIEIKGRNGDVKVPGVELVNDLSSYFDREDIIIAIKKLLFADIIKETRCGVRNIAQQNSYRDIRIDDATLDIMRFETSLMDAAKVYFASLITEFEYIANMAVSIPLYLDNSNPIVQEHLKESSVSKRRRIEYCKSNRERLGYLFLLSMLNVLKSNIGQYETLGVLSDFSEIFIEKDTTVELSNMYKPWTQMIKNYIETLERKIRFGTHSASKKAELQKLLSAAKELEMQGTAYCNEVKRRMGQFRTL